MIKEELQNYRPEGIIDIDSTDAVKKAKELPKSPNRNRKYRWTETQK